MLSVTLGEACAVSYRPPVGIRAKSQEGERGSGREILENPAKETGGFGCLS